MNRAYIRIASNVHKKMNYPKALRRLRAIGDVVAISSVYETPSILNPRAESSYNGVALMETELDAHTLKRALRIIETQLGCVRTADPDAPRTIDLDVVLFNQDIIDEDDVHLPDPQILQRSFLILALAEISSQYVHPSDGRTLGEITNALGLVPIGVRRVPTATTNARQILNHIDRRERVHA